MDKIEAVTALRTMLRDMERELGLSVLSGAEKDILLAANSLSKELGDVISSDNIRRHALVEPHAQATYHRALRALVGRGLIKKASGSKARAYVVCLEAPNTE
ncbi:hypothetical protein [Pseudogemmobacter sp. W21_MBD1_M6]|uniref:hypothetical protein n=1 Tax=Pseudogemmobacter sp. W21_MBD1_M6 TaxID=3240271 RepID=UPI003F97EDE2